MKDFILNLTGNIALSLFFASFFFAFVGVAISLLTSAAKRDQLNPTTPNIFSWAFLLSDNFKRMVGNFLLIYVSIRFYPLLFERIFGPATDSKEVYLIGCLLIGLGWDKLLEFWKQKGNFLKVRKDDINEIKPVG